MKYIVVELEGVEHLFLFDMSIRHSVFAKRFNDGLIISAGFISPFKGQCSGESYSLGISSRPEKDTVLLEKIKLFLS